MACRHAGCAGDGCCAGLFSHEVDITLPDSSDISDENDVQQRPTEPHDDAQRLSITAHNVQNVIATLERPESYYIRVENVVSYRDEGRVAGTELGVFPV